MRFALVPPRRTLVPVQSGVNHMDIRAPLVVAICTGVFVATAMSLGSPFRVSGGLGTSVGVEVGGCKAQVALWQALVLLGSASRWARTE